MDRSEVEVVRARTDIVELISTYTALKRVGSKWKGLCPFHQEKTPSFNVDPETGRWQCFGACSEGGDAFKFLEKAESLSFPEALQRLANRAGITLTPRGATEAEREASRQVQSERDRVFEANALANRFFRQCLRRDRLAQEYAAQRGLAHQTLEDFQIGYAPDDWSQLSEFLRREKVHSEDAVKAGLILPSRRGDGTFTDRFRGRLIFPIVDVQERIVGFGGRLIVDKPDAPKYLNSPETPVFIKGKTLYGLNRARKSLAGEDKALVVEGYMDVVAAHQAGIGFVIATLGTSLTEEHVRLLRRYAKNIVLSFDSDDAGVKAALRAAELLSTAGDDLTLRVLSLPRGEDPDSLLKKGDIGGFRRAIDAAITVPEFRLKTLEARFDIRTERGRVALLQEAVNIIASVPSLLEQDRLIRRVAAFHPSYATSGLRAEESVRAEVQRARGGRPTEDLLASSEQPTGYRRGGGQNGYNPNYGNGAFVKGNGLNAAGGRYAKNRPPQQPFVQPDTVPVPTITRNGAEEAEQTVLRALLSDEWAPVLHRCVGERGGVLPTFSNQEHARLATALWPLIEGHLSPAEVLKQLADPELADQAANLLMVEESTHLSENVIEDALRSLETDRYQREMEQIRSRLEGAEEGKGSSHDELLRQWSERARTLKRGISSSDEDNRR